MEDNILYYFETAKEPYFVFSFYYIRGMSQ